MPLKNGNTVSVERRVDLTSLFCMIGRHGPAVAVAVIAMVSVLAGFVIYRNVRGKRRKATAAAAAAADGDGVGDGVGDGDASVMHECHGSVESTVNDEGSSDVKEVVDPTPSDLRIRHRRAAAEKIPAPRSPPESGARAPGFQRTAADDTEEAARRVAAACAEEVIKGALEELHAGCVKEPEPMDADRRERGAAAGSLLEETRMVSASECQEDEDIFDETPRREDIFQCALNNPVCFQLTSNMSDGDDGLREETTNGVGSHPEEPAGDIEDVSVPWLYDGKDEEFERESTEGNTRLSPEGESRNESEEAEEHRLDHLLIGQLAEVQSSTFQRNSNRPSETDEAPPPVCYSDCDEDGGPAGEGVAQEDRLNNLDAPSAQSAERAVEMELEGSEERDCLSVALGPTLDCWSVPVKADDLDGGLPATGGIAEVDDLSLDRQPLQKEDDTVPSLDAKSIFLQGDVNALLAEERVDQCPSQDWQSDQTKTDNANFSEVATAVIGDLNPRLRQVDLPSLEQFALMDYDVSCAGVGEESGISSMTVTPDAGNEYDVIFGNTAVPPVRGDLKCEGQTEARSSVFADDADISVTEEDTAGMVLRPRPSHLSGSPRSERAAWTIYESLASSQDAFGHEIEDSYHRAVDQFAAQMAGGVTCFTEKHSEVSVVVRTKEKKKKKGGSVDMKEATKSAKGKEEDCEKTEISIMEATMDHNEWITDGNCQAFPWMNLSATDDTKSNPLPSEERQDLHATVQQDGALSLIYENVKSVVVQPMAQNVDVTFSIHYVTQSPYQRVGVMGNQQALGNWKGFVPLEDTVDGHWAAVVRLPAESHVEWKFVVVDEGEVCRWEECGNRLLNTGSGDELLVQKCWARL